MEKLYHKGIMRTKMDDCQFVCIAQSDYYRILHQVRKMKKYHQISDISRTLVGNEIVDYSDVVGAAPVGAAPTTSSFST